MANVFPDIYPTVWEPDWEPYQGRDESADGYLQINAYDPVDQFDAHGEWTTLKRTQLDQIRTHRDAFKDVSFGLFDFWYTTAKAVVVAVATGGTNIYTLPGKEFSGSVTIKHNGSAAIPQPTLNVGAGEDGKTQITYLANPGAGIVITVDADNHRHWYEVFYRAAKWSPRHEGADVWSLALDFVQKVVA